MRTVLAYRVLALILIMVCQLTGQTGAPPSVSLTSPANGSSFVVPTDITLSAAASDPDGSITKVEFYQDTVKKGEATAAPYNLQLTNVPAGTYQFNAVATDNSGNSATSAPVSVTVNPMEVQSPSDPCPQASYSSNGIVFELRGQSATFGIKLHPCEQITVTERKLNTSDLYSQADPRLTFYNYLGQPIISQLFNGCGQCGNLNYFPSTFSDRTPWQGVRTPEQLPAYLIVLADSPVLTGLKNDDPPIFDITIARSPRPGYNTGGIDESSAPTPTQLHASYYGSMRPPEKSGQWFKVRLNPGQQFRIAGEVRTSPTYSPLFYLDLYDANHQKVINQWVVKNTSNGYRSFTSTLFTNPSPTQAADFYVNLYCQYYNIWDFRLDVISDSCPAVPRGAFPAPDATPSGSLSTVVTEYKLPATVDSDVLSENDFNSGEFDVFPSDPNLTGREIELWASVYRPSTLGTGPYPLIIMLAGNHATCGDSTKVPREDSNSEYTLDGTCPPGFEVVQSHRGYDYLANRLATRGYIVVSINANRGITGVPPGVALPPNDPQFILARARLILKHLQQLSEWNANGGTPSSVGVELQGKLDFSKIGLFGHSRGGDGVRAAYNLYTGSDAEAQKWHTLIKAQIQIKGIFEVGPTDYSPQQFVAPNVHWNVLIPMCDMDVWRTLGVHVFDRMVLGTEESDLAKSTYTVWGANHNYYNTEWQQNDSTGCIGIGNVPLFSAGDSDVGSAPERTTALASVLAFFRSAIGASTENTYSENFNPLFSLPPVTSSIARVERGFTQQSTRSRITDFQFTVGTDLCTTGEDCSGVVARVDQVCFHHDPSLKVASLNWATTGSYFQTNVENGLTIDASPFQYLELRIARQPIAKDQGDSTNFSIQLKDISGALSNEISACDYVDLRGPAGSYNPETGAQDVRPILQTVLIPLSAITGVDKTRISGVRFTFDKSGAGAIYVTNLRFSD